MPDRVVYPGWGPIPIRTLPARSHLYHLQPVGVGTAQVESLTSYLIRLAEVHDVSPGILLNRELLPKVREAFRRPGRHTSANPESAFMYRSHTLNGVVRRAHNWISMLESVTRVQHIQCLTMTTWSQVISERGLLRQYRAWCPLCFDDWRCSNQPVYEPLLWSIREVLVCPVHVTLLEDRCAHCGREVHVISAKSRPGHCCRCGCWLGGRQGTPDTSSDGRVKIAVAEGIGELLSVAANLPEVPSRECFQSNLQLCIEELAEGNLSRFAVALGVSFDVLSDWFAPSRLVRLGFLSRLCGLVGISPLRFVSQRLKTDDVDRKHGRSVVVQSTSHIPARRSMPQLRPVLEQAATSDAVPSLRELAIELGYSKAQSLRRRDPELCGRISDNYRTAFAAPRATSSLQSFPPNDVIKEALSSALAQPSPPRLKTIAKALGFCNEVSLYNRFPTLCKAFATKNRLIKQKKLDACRSLVEAAASEESPRTLKEISGRMGSSVRSMRHRFPDLCDRIVARGPELKLFRRQQQSAEIQRALNQEPAPSTKSVATRVGMSASYLRKLHPDLYAQIRKRHFDLKYSLASGQRSAFRTEIRAAVLSLSQRGLHPSRKRVFAAITNPSMRSTKILDEQISEIVLELQLASGTLHSAGCDKNQGPLGREPSAGRAELEP